MTHIKQLKEEYIIPFADTGDVLPDILCDSPWGNEDLEVGEDWTL